MKRSEKVKKLNDRLWNILRYIAETTPSMCKGLAELILETVEDAGMLPPDKYLDQYDQDADYSWEPEHETK